MHAWLAVRDNAMNIDWSLTRRLLREDQIYGILWYLKLIYYLLFTVQGFIISKVINSGGSRISRGRQLLANHRPWIEQLHLF